VDYSNQNSIRTQTNCGKAYESQHVIVTLPLGVLKSRDVEFVPGLPKSKLASIDRLGVSLLEKLFLEFDGEVFWDPNVDLLNIIQDDWTLIVNSYKLHLRKPVLCMFNYGSRCVKYSKYTDE